MAEEQPGRELPQRVRGAARAGPPRPGASSTPVLSEELRQRMRAAVTAERSGTATEHDETPGGETTSPEPVPPVRPRDGRRESLARRAAPVRSEAPVGSEAQVRSEAPVRPETPVRSEPPAASEPAARPARPANAGPIAEDEITEWLGTTAKPPPPATLPSAVAPPSGATSPAPVKPPAGPSPAGAPRPAGRPSPRRPRARRLARFAAVALVIGVLAGAGVGYFGRSPAGSPASTAAARHAAQVRAAAASWVAYHVSRDVKVSCDPAMCAALRARGFPPGELLVLGSNSAVPVSSAVVIETPAVLSLFGSSLASAWAPAILASFGSGPSLVAVRVIDRNGATGYQNKLSSDLADRRAAGAALLNDSQITVPALASSQLTAGAVDSRLLEALVFVAGHESISIVQFGNPGPGASADIPLRYVDLAERDPKRHLSSAAYVKSLRTYLSTANAEFRPSSMTTVTLAYDQAVLRIEVDAPSPLGVFGSP
jgi:hypothetical protein